MGIKRVISPFSLMFFRQVHPSSLSERYKNIDCVNKTVHLSQLTDHRLQGSSPFRGWAQKNISKSQNKGRIESNLFWRAINCGWLAGHLRLHRPEPSTGPAGQENLTSWARRCFCIYIQYENSVDGLGKEIRRSRTTTPTTPPRNICDWLRLEKGFGGRMQKHLKRLQLPVMKGRRGTKRRWGGTAAPPLLQTPNIGKERGILGSRDEEWTKKQVERKNPKTANGTNSHHNRHGHGNAPPPSPICPITFLSHHSLKTKCRLRRRSGGRPQA